VVPWTEDDVRGPASGGQSWSTPSPGRSGRQGLHCLIAGQDRGAVGRLQPLGAVNYRKETREFVCPCHGGKYDIAGRNIAAAAAPLTGLPVQVKDGIVLVGVKV